MFSGSINYEGKIEWQGSFCGLYVAEYAT